MFKGSRRLPCSDFSGSFLCQNVARLCFWRMSRSNHSVTHLISNTHTPHTHMRNFLSSLLICPRRCLHISRILKWVKICIHFILKFALCKYTKGFREVFCHKHQALHDWLKGWPIKYKTLDECKPAVKSHKLHFSSHVSRFITCSPVFKESLAEKIASKMFKLNQPKPYTLLKLAFEN